MSALLRASSVASAGTRAKRPNAPVIIADDMNDYGFYETSSGVKMPCLGRFMQTAATSEKACGEATFGAVGPAGVGQVAPGASGPVSCEKERMGKAQEPV